MTLRLSIVIPNLNSLVVDQTLSAIRAQRFDMNRVETLVVGLDEPGLVKEDAIVRQVSTTGPAPPAVARNIGLDQAVGDIVVFTDADCVPQPDWLAHLTAGYAERDASVIGGAVTFDLTGYWTLADNVSSFHEFLTDRPRGPRPHLPSLNLSARRDALVAAGGFDERYPLPAGEDSDLSYRLRQLGHTLLFEPTAVVQHRPSRSSLTDLLRHAANFGRYSVKLRPHPHGGLGQRLLRHRWLTLAAAPILATIVTGRIFWRRPSLWAYAHTIPAIYAAKLAWCWGATRSPDWVRNERPPAPA